MDQQYGRRTWEFEIEAGNLVEPCKRKLAHAKERQEFWKGEFTRLEVDARAKLKIESLPPNLDKFTSGYADPGMVSIPPEILASLRQASSKVREWSLTALLYTRWVFILEQWADDTVALTIEDVEFFGLGEEAVAAVEEQ